MTSSLYEIDQKIDNDTFTESSFEIWWPAKWLPEVVQSLKSLNRLSTNWDSYGANCISRTSIDFATGCVIQLARITKLKPEVAAFPSGNAALCWEWDLENKSLEVEFLPTGFIRCCYTDLENETNNVEKTVPSFGKVDAIQIAVEEVLQCVKSLTAK